MGDDREPAPTIVGGRRAVAYVVFAGVVLIFLVVVNIGDGNLWRGRSAAYEKSLRETQKHMNRDPPKLKYVARWSTDVPAQEVSLRSAFNMNWKPPETPTLLYVNISSMLLAKKKHRHTGLLAWPLRVLALGSSNKNLQPASRPLHSLSSFWQVPPDCHSSFEKNHPEGPEEGCQNVQGCCYMESEGEGECNVCTHPELAVTTQVALLNNGLEPVAMSLQNASEIEKKFRIQIKKKWLQEPSLTKVMLRSLPVYLPRNSDPLHPWPAVHFTPNFASLRSLGAEVFHQSLTLFVVASVINDGTIVDGLRSRFELCTSCYEAHGRAAIRVSYRDPIMRQGPCGHRSLIDGEWHIFSGVFNRSHSALYADGVLEAQGALGHQVLKGFTMGSAFNGGNAADGIVAEAIVVSGALDHDKRDEMEQWLADKYGTRRYLNNHEACPEEVLHRMFGHVGEDPATVKATKDAYLWSLSLSWLCLLVSPLGIVLACLKFHGVGGSVMGMALSKTEILCVSGLFLAAFLAITVCSSALAMIFLFA